MPGVGPASASVLRANPVAPWELRIGDLRVYYETVDDKPILALMPLPPDTDPENLVVTTHPRFQAVIERSEARYRAEAGVSTAEVRLRLAARRAARKKARVPRDRA